MRRSFARNRLVLADDVAERLAERLEEEAPDFDDRRLHLQECLKRLPDRARAVVEMRYREGVPARKVAVALSSSDNAVTLLLFRARQMLARCMEDRSMERLAGEGVE